MNEQPQTQPTEDQPNPDLLAAGDEIVAIMQKYDLAGAVTLTDSRHTRYSFNLATGWSILTAARDGELRADRDPRDFESQQAYRDAIENTYIGINTLGQNLSQQTGILAAVLQVVEQKRKPSIIMPDKRLATPGKMNGG